MAYSARWLTEAGKKVDFSDEITIYKKAVKDQTACLEADMADETKL